MKKLQTSYNFNANKIVKQATKEESAIKNLNLIINLAIETKDTKTVPEEPKSFTKACNHPNANYHIKWQQAIKKEFPKMNKQQEWHETRKSFMPL